MTSFGRLGNGSVNSSRDILAWLRGQERQFLAACRDMRSAESHERDFTEHPDVPQLRWMAAQSRERARQQVGESGLEKLRELCDHYGAEEVERRLSLALGLAQFQQRVDSGEHQEATIASVQRWKRSNPRSPKLAQAEALITKHRASLRAIARRGTPVRRARGPQTAPRAHRAHATPRANRARDGGAKSDDPPDPPLAALDPRDLLSVAVVGRIAKLHRSVIYKLGKRGDLAVVRIPGNGALRRDHVRITRASLEEFAEGYERGEHRVARRVAV